MCSASSGGSRFLVSRSCRETQDVLDSQEIVDSVREGEHPTAPAQTFELGLAQWADGVQPAEDLFYALSLPLADLIAWMAGYPFVDRARVAVIVLRHMWRHFQTTQLLGEVARVIGFVGTEGEARFATTKPWRLSIVTWPMYESRDSLPAPFLKSRASRSVVD